MPWAEWRTLNPDSRVVPDQTGIPQSYRLYPYGSYEWLSDTSFLGFPVPRLDGWGHLSDWHEIPAAASFRSSISPGSVPKSDTKVGRCTADKAWKAT